MEEMIRTENLTKCYHGKPVVDGVKLEVPKKAIYGFLGPNGAGKSTTMKMLLGLVRPDEGQIWINGRPMEEKSRVEILKGTGSLIENPSYYGNLTARENLKISCLLRNLPETEIDRVLEIVRLKGQEKKKTAHFSLGMKQRLGLANALLGSPKLVLLDEPTNGLDPAGIHEMRGLIQELPKKYGMTVMLSSHLLAEVEQTADYIGMLSGGRLIFQDTLSMLRARSQRRLILRTSDQEGAANIFRQQAGILAQVCPGGLICPELPDGTLASLLRRLMEHGIDLYRVEEEKQSLEDLYLGMVKEAGL